MTLILAVAIIWHFLGKAAGVLLPRPQKMPQVGGKLPRSSSICGGGVFFIQPLELASTMILTEEVNFSELFEPFLTNKIESSFDNCKDII